MVFSQMPASIRQKNKKLALKLGTRTHQILTNDDEVCIPSRSSNLFTVYILLFFFTVTNQ